MADDAGRLNQVFAETSFLYGSNAAFIEDLHEQWATDPASVSAEWRAFFDQLRDNADEREGLGAAGQLGPLGRVAEPTEETGVFDGRWPAPKPDPKKPSRAGHGRAAAAAAGAAVSADAVRAAAHDSIRALMLIRSYRVRGHLQANARSAGHRAADQQSRADARILRLHRGRPGPADLSRRRAGPADRRRIREVLAILQAHLLRQHRHPVHAHRRAGREVLAAGALRGPDKFEQNGFTQRGQAGHPEQADRGRGLRALPAQALPRHQAVRPGRRRGHGPGAGADHQARRRPGRRRDRLRHGPPRAG